MLKLCVFSTGVNKELLRNACKQLLIPVCVSFTARSWKSFWKSLCDLRVYTTPSDIWRQTRTAVCQTYIPVQVKIWHPKMQIWFRRESFWIWCGQCMLWGQDFARAPMQVDPPAFRNSRHECSHLLKEHACWYLGQMLNIRRYRTHFANFIEGCYFLWNTTRLFYMGKQSWGKAL